MFFPGLPLLPLLDGTITTIHRVAPGQVTVYVGSPLERQLLGKQTSCLVDSETVRRETADRSGCATCPLYLNPRLQFCYSVSAVLLNDIWCVWCRLTAVARTGSLNLQLIDSTALVDVFLPRLMPQSWQGQASVAWQAGINGEPTAEWITMLWQELQVCL